MATALSKEMGMMEAQLNRWKEIAHEALSLREESQSLKDLLVEKVLLHSNWIFFRSCHKIRYSMVVVIHFPFPSIYMDVVLDSSGTGFRRGYLSRCQIHLIVVPKGV